MVAALVACGGGGGDSGTPVNGGGGSTNPGGGTTIQPTMSLALSSTTVTAAAPATASVTVKDGTGAGVAGVVVNFTVAGGLGVPQPASALTDVNGVAKTTLVPASGTAAGADNLTATATVGGTSLTASGGFQLTATDVSISAFTADVTSLGAYGQTGLVVDLAGTTPAAPVTVTLSSSCVTGNHATLTPASVTTSTGRATFTLRDNGCGSYQATDSLRATVSGSAAARDLSLSVVAPSVASVTFSAASPATIYLKGSGAAENSNVTFKIVDANGNGVPNQSVSLVATTWAGGLTLDGVTNQALTKLSDANGDVIVRVNSGTVPTPVRVKAALVSKPEIQAVSSVLSIAVGLPSQLNFSLAQGTPNIEGLDVDGTPNSYTVTVSDRMGNPVPDGTAVNFVAEGGQVNASATTVKNANGIATATARFSTSEPRPADGRVTVTAFALGEESFIDQNGNNVYDNGEPFQDLGDIFVDRLFNNFYNADVDQLIPASLGATQTCSDWPTGAAADLLKPDQSIPIKPGSCDQVWGRAYVRRSVVTVFSTSASVPVFPSLSPNNVQAVNFACARRELIDFDNYFGVDDSNTATTWKGYSPDAASRPNKVKYLALGSGTHFGGSLTFLVSDANPKALNPMPAGTVITAAASTGITVEVLGGSPVAASLKALPATIGYTFATGTTSGRVTVNIKSPGGTTTSVTQAVSAFNPGGSACP
ncbi:hypothetical protein CDL60_22335 [Roseateles noduli]|nr:hypothetical protein CDL60_22335 [Roseateles noduli]